MTFGNGPRKKPAPRPSMRAAINAKCKDCIYDPGCGAGTWRKQVEDCTSPLCPLYPLRPISKGEKTAEKGPLSDGEENDPE